MLVVLFKFLSHSKYRKSIKNVKECGIYFVIKIQCMKNVSGRVVPPSGTLINCNVLVEKIETLYIVSHFL